MKSILFEELKKHGVKNPWDLTEFDTWVNDATREELNYLADSKDCFGLEMYDYKIIEKDRLKNICNFGVNYIFENKDKDRVLKEINDYRNVRFDGHRLKDFVNNLQDLSIYSCIWV